MKVASTWKRILARLIDQLILGLIIIPMLLFFPTSEGWMYIPYAAAFGIVVIPVVYESAFYYLMKATPGKWIFNLTVVPFGGSNYKNWGGRVLVRATANYLTLFFGWAVYATGFFNSERRHLCDWIAETRVVGNDPIPNLKRRLILGTVLVVFGVTGGLAEARYRFGLMDFEQGVVRIPDPFDFSSMVPSEDN